MSLVLIGSMRIAFTGISGKLPLTSVQEVPRLTVRKICPGVAGVFPLYPENPTNARLAFAGSIAMEVTERSGNGAAVTFAQLVPVFVVTWTAATAVPPVVPA